MKKLKTVDNIKKTDELRIRNVDTQVVLKLNDMARKRGMSRSEYVRGVLSNHAYAAEIKELDNRYQELFKIVIETIEGNTSVLHSVLNKLEEHTKLLQGINDTEEEEEYGTETFLSGRDRY